VIEESANIDLAPLSPILARYENRGREALLPLLHEAQAEYGWLPGPVQQAIGELLRVPLADVHGVIEFYTLFYSEPTPKRVIRVCGDPACRLAGSSDVEHALGERLRADDRDSIAVEQVTCLGMCESAPAALDGTRPAGELNIASLTDFLDGSYLEPKAKVFGEPLWILGRLGNVDPGSLADYEAQGGFRVLRQMLELEPETVLELVDQCDILGRGGAMFSLGRKWRFTRDAPGSPGDKHIVVNADESEPGTFKDRCIIEEDPFAIVEAATLAAYAVGAKNGWLFVRGEYPRGYARLQNAVDKAREAGYLGKNVMGRGGFHFDIELRLGAGAYICGEETALFEAIEGKRGFPRIKPPFPVTHGLFHKPTAVNNVETLAALLAALRIGPEKWREVGTADSPGTKLFCLSGNVARPGVYEVPFGLTIRQLIEMAGGVPEGKSIRAVLMGGAAGVFVGPEGLDTRLTYEDSGARGVPLGSGVVMVFDQDADLRDVLYQLSHFFTHESCGKCYPCQLGTQRQMEILRRVARDGTAMANDRQALLDVGFAMSKTSLCGLGQTAASAVVSALELWPELVE
jgi:NADH-quinone oxidoreductase subunit F